MIRQSLHGSESKDHCWDVAELDEGEVYHTAVGLSHLL